MNKLKLFIYPYSLVSDSDLMLNPYIGDLCDSLEQNGVVCVNKGERGHLLLSSYKYIGRADAFLLNWIENVPLYNFGIGQFLYTLMFILILKLRRKKIIWVRHNLVPHTVNSAFKSWMCMVIMKIMKRRADIVITHSSNGIDDICSKDKRGYYIIHPIKKSVIRHSEKVYDLLIWGSIARYKGVVEFLKFNRDTPSLRKNNILVVGKCSDKALESDILNCLAPNVTFENRKPEFNELNGLMQAAKYVLIPYNSPSVLSSGVLMDSLSSGASVIGPAKGAFLDLSKDSRLNVLTFNDFSELESLIKREVHNKIDNYYSFIEENSWDNFAKKMVTIITDENR